MDIEGIKEEKPIRCGWLTNDPIYINYHDEEWGKPEYDSLRLFELLCLEGQQAGLSWLTILKKRDSYRKLFHNFDPHIVSKFTENDVKILVNNPDIVRHKGKIEAIINNSRCYKTMNENDENFSEFVWSFVEHKPIVNCWHENSEVPSETEVSIALSKALKKRRYKYVGSKITYAFMQACGLVNDHITNCIYRVKTTPINK